MSCHVSVLASRSVSVADDADYPPTTLSLPCLKKLEDRNRTGISKQPPSPCVHEGEKNVAGKEDVKHGAYIKIA